MGARWQALRGRLRQLDRWVLRAGLPFAVPWWGWSALMLVCGAGALTMALLVTPTADEHLTLFGDSYGSDCAFRVNTGYPCPACGMTRSWVWAARGHLLRSFLYSPAGSTLFCWLVLAGGLGAARLARRDPAFASIPTGFLAAWAIVWMIGLYLLPWLARFAGINPLP